MLFPILVNIEMGILIKNPPDMHVVVDQPKKRILKLKLNCSIEAALHIYVHHADREWLAQRL